MRQLSQYRLQPGVRLGLPGWNHDGNCDGHRRRKQQLYLYVHGDGIAQRRFDRTGKGQAALDTYDRPTDYNRSAAAQIEHSKRLLEAGVIGQEEYDKLKGHALEYGA